ncbi:hypothetical protein BC938DRAFT_474695 [Jimgerdemannia flammicorona]|uniref:Galactose oxidase n=1 Tax=Jimgerdemannia flammicorona TaxID=994334 RepID=A0A433Q1Q4_9FUNG|nr:hypothetical protein BC938DRAFT_474695 [Jimgerdemannia flammicorona]
MVRKLSTLCAMTIAILAGSDVTWAIQFREQFASAVVNKILYVHGGTLVDLGLQTPLNELYALNLSTPFTVSTAPWFSLNSSTGPVHIPALLSHVAGAGGPTNSLFFVYGGLNTTNSSSSAVYYFDPVANEWSQPTVEGAPTTGPVGGVAVSDLQTHALYVWGGQNVTQSPVLVLDTRDPTKLAFSTVAAQADGPPGPRSYATWSMLSTGVAVLIGGAGPNATWLSLITVWAFDTASLKWSMHPFLLTRQYPLPHPQNTTGAIPSPRIRHSAAVTAADEIVVYGSTFQSVSPPDPLIVLSTTNGSYSWRVVNATNSPFSKYEFLLAGAYYAGNVLVFFDDPQGTIHDLDTTTWQWTDSYVPRADATVNGTYSSTSSGSGQPSVAGRVEVVTWAGAIVAGVAAMMAMGL